MAIYLLTFFLTGVSAYEAADCKRRYRGALACPALPGDGAGVPVLPYAPLAVTPPMRRRYLVRYRIWFWLAVLPLFLITALRHDVGTDYFYTYVPEFYRILNGESAGYSEWGFNTLIRAIQAFTTNVQWLFCITGFLFTFLVVRTIILMSGNAPISVAVLFASCVWFWSLNNVRQAIAAAVILSVSPYMTKLCGANAVRLLAAVAFGVLFHKSVVVWLPVLVILYIPLCRRYFRILAPATLAALPLLCRLAEVLLRQTHYGGYFNSQFNSGTATTVPILYNGFFFLAAWWVLAKDMEKDTAAYAYVLIQYAAFLAATASIYLTMPEMISRITMFFQMFQVLLIPRCYARIAPGRYGWRKYAVVAVYLLAYGAYLVRFILIKGYHGVLPYQWCFGK